MPVLIINRSEVRELLPMSDCIDPMAQTLAAHARGEAILPQRTRVNLPGEDLLLIMPSYLKTLPALGVKVLTIFPGNHRSGIDSHQGAVLLFDASTGSLQAVLDATAITAIRTAAVSAAATRCLARPEAGDLAIIGAGTQARTHLEAMLKVRRIRRVRLWSMPVGQAHEFSRWAQQARHVKVEVSASARQAVEGADLVCTVTSASEPVLMGEWLSAGAHVNAVGAYTPTRRELDSQAVVRSRLFVDRREAALTEAGEFLIPRSEGLITDDHIQGEVGAVLAGMIPGRQGSDEVTLFKSLGLAIEDLAAAQYVFQQALLNGLGKKVELGI